MNPRPANLGALGFVTFPEDRAPVYPLTVIQDQPSDTRKALIENEFVTDDLKVFSIDMFFPADPEYPLR